MQGKRQFAITYPDNVLFGGRASRDEIIDAVRRLQSMHQAGILGGSVMPEDANPGLPKSAIENYHYFTLTMALNYRRNSYALWKAASKTYSDFKFRAVFRPRAVVDMDDDTLRKFLTTYGLALQPKTHTKVWRRICESIVELLDGDIRNLFESTSGSVPSILTFIQKQHGAGFPCLKGPKICNYWLYVMSRYTDVILRQREALNVAPDTHVIQATVHLGMIKQNSTLVNDKLPELVARRWSETLEGTGIAPIDVHTALWLWSRSGFIPIH